jgi:hypothetical protein
VQLQTVMCYGKVQLRGALQLKDRPQSSIECGNDIFSRRNYTFGSWCSQRSLKNVILLRRVLKWNPMYFDKT